MVVEAFVGFRRVSKEVSKAIIITRRNRIAIPLDYSPIFGLKINPKASQKPPAMELKLNINH